MPSRSPLWPEQFVFPSYTEEARLSRAQSYAIVTAVLDETGQVSEIYLTKGAPYGLDAASLAAVAKWRFEEGTAARRVEVIVHFSFGIEQKSGDDDRPASQTWFTEQDRCRSPQPNA